MTEFGDLVKSLRKGKGLTLQEVADRVGTEKGYISGIEHSKVNPPAPDKVRKLAKVLDFDRTELLLMAYIQKAPAEIRAILGRGAKLALEERKKEKASSKVAAVN